MNFLFVMNLKSYKSVRYFLDNRTVRKGEKVSCHVQVPNFHPPSSLEMPQAASINRSLLYDLQFDFLALSKEHPEYSCQPGRLHESKFAAIVNTFAV